MEAILDLNTDNDRSSDLIRKAIWGVYLSMIFSGVIRKWILPELSSVFFFMSDFFVIIIYATCLINKSFPRSPLAILSYFGIGAYFILILVQILMNDSTALAIIYGYRNYFFLVPLPFILEKFLTIKDLKQIAYITCVLAIPSVILVYFQYTSPPEAFINKNVGEEQTKIFIVAKDVVRPSGFFSFAMGQAHYTVSIFLMIFFNYFLPKKEKFLSPLLNGIVMFAAIGNLAMSGARTTFGYVLVLICFLIISGFLLFNKTVGARIIGFLIIGGIMSYFVLTTVFARNMELILERIETASHNEGSWLDRFLEPFGAFIYAFTRDIPFLGFGLGTESSGAATAFASRSGNEWYYESEWLRFIAEAGIVFGLIYLSYRLYLSFYILKKTFYTLKILGNPIPFLFTGCIFLTILSGPMTFNGVTFYYGWFFLGLTLAANKIFSGDYQKDEL